MASSNVQRCGATVSWKSNRLLDLVGRLLIFQTPPSSSAYAVLSRCHPQNVYGRGRREKPVIAGNDGNVSPLKLVLPRRASATLGTRPLRSYHPSASFACLRARPPRLDAAPASTASSPFFMQTYPLARAAPRVAPLSCTAEATSIQPIPPSVHPSNAGLPQPFPTQCTCVPHAIFQGADYRACCPPHCTWLARLSGYTLPSIHFSPVGAACFDLGCAVFSAEQENVRAAERVNN
ncbi:hypothetical protein FB451DRAFT_1173228 [Mycena latifolia]|nr:hypothetical protein FB451DRAFT_1173228 [Mycena latifolia]